MYSPTNPCASINVQTRSATCLFPYYYQLWLVLSLLINLMTRSSLLLLTFSGPSAPTQLCRGACQRHLCDAVRDLPCSRGCVGLHLRVGGGIRAAAEVSKVWTCRAADGALSFICVFIRVHCTTALIRTVGAWLPPEWGARIRVASEVAVMAR